MQITRRRKKTNGGVALGDVAFGVLLLEFFVEFLAFFFAEERGHRLELFDSFAQLLNLNLLAEIGLTEANTK